LSSRPGSSQFHMLSSFRTEIDNSPILASALSFPSAPLWPKVKMYKVIKGTQLTHQHRQWQDARGRECGCQQQCIRSNRDHGDGAYLS
jgi:hypothetical protein